MQIIIALILGAGLGWLARSVLFQWEHDCANPDHKAMRSPEEIQHAHDLLVGLITGDIPNPVPPEQMPVVNGACDVLCWLLEHSHNPTFADNLRNLENSLRDCGVVLERRNPQAN